MTGIISKSYTEDAYLSTVEASQRDTCRFTAKEWDEETKLYYMSARYQNPQTSRWISSDPAGFDLLGPMEKNDQGKMSLRSEFSVVESVNWYSYVSGNPVKYSDPTGKKGNMEVTTESTLSPVSNPVDFILLPLNWFFNGGKTTIENAGRDRGNGTSGPGFNITIDHRLNEGSFSLKINGSLAKANIFTKGDSGFGNSDKANGTSTSLDLETCFIDFNLGLDEGSIGGAIDLGLWNWTGTVDAKKNNQKSTVNVGLGMKIGIGFAVGLKKLTGKIPFISVGVDYEGKD